MLMALTTVAGTSAYCRGGNRQHQKSVTLTATRKLFSVAMASLPVSLKYSKETAKYIKSVTKTPIRINTNGLSDLINKRETPAEFKGLVDIISISLNASDAKAYDEITRPSFKGVNCFEEMLSFAKRVKEFVPEVMLTVVDIIGEEEIKKSQAVADSVGIHLRVREYVD